MKNILTITLILIYLTSTAIEKERLKEILSSGNGSSFEKAYHIKNIDEEYIMLAYDKQTPSTQMLMVFKGESYDVFIDKNTGKQTYFKLMPKEKFANIKEEERCL